MKSTMSTFTTHRNSRVILAIGFLTLALSLLVSVAFATDSLASRDVEVAKAKAVKQVEAGSYIVVYRNKVSLSSRLKTEESRGIDVDEVYRNVFKGFSADLEPEDVRRLERDDSVLIVEPNRKVTTQVNGPQDRSTPSWGLDRVDQRNLPLNNRLVTNDNGFGVEAYVIDTGVRLDHSEFSGRINPEGFSAFSGGWNDCEGHGTHVAGTVAGSTFGLAPAARVTAIRVLDCRGSGTVATVIAGIDWMIGDHGAGEPAVANMSLGGGRSETENLAVQRAVDDGITMVVAAGNSAGNACLESPASAPAAVTVGSTTSSDAMSSFSNYGPCVDIYAPGSSIRSASASSPTASETLSGTSMASPHVAGAAALLLSRNPAMSPTAVSDRLVASSTPNKVTQFRGCDGNRLLYVGTDADLPAPTQPDGPANDNFSNRQALSSLSTVNGNSDCATAESGEPGHAQSNPHASIWYRWTAPSDGTLTVNTNGSSFDTTLAVYTGSSIGSLVRQAQDDDSGDGLNSRFSLSVTGGTTYSIAIDGYEGDSGNTRLAGTFNSGGGGDTPPETDRPTNDDFSAATRVNGWQSSINTTNEAATAEAGEPSHSPWDDDPAEASIWYRWTAPSNGSLELDTSSRWGKNVAVYTGSSLGNLTEVGKGWTDVTVPVRSGTEYRIAIDSFSATSTESITINGDFTAAPANDDFADATRISSINSTITGTNTAATVEPGEPSHAWQDSGDPPIASVWYRWTPRSNGILTLDASLSQFSYPDIGVYTGSSISSLNRIDAGMDALTIPVRAGTEYSIAIDTWSPRQLGTVRLSGSFTAAPANDDFNDAAAIPKWSGVIRGTSLGATAEPGERPHIEGDDEGPYHSVWYRWTAPWSGAVGMIDVSSDFFPDLLLPDFAVYTGQSVESLSRVSGSSYSASWSVTKGITYWIAVDGTYFDDEARFAYRLRRNLKRVKIMSGPRKTTTSRVARFRFAGDEGAGFQCRLSGQSAWKQCGAQTTFRRLKPGRHVLSVRQKYGSTTQPSWMVARHRWSIGRGR